LSNAFFVITLGDLETFDPLPELNRRVVIADGKFSGVDVAAHLFAGANLGSMRRLRPYENLYQNSLFGSRGGDLRDCVCGRPTRM
jgi:hypothetical protein